MPVSKEIQITLKVKATDIFRLKDKVALFEGISNSKQEHQEMILKIFANPKALQMLYDNRTMLESMVN